MKRVALFSTALVFLGGVLLGCPQSTTTVTIPDVSGQTESAATQALENSGLRVTRLETVNAEVPVGQVVRTIPVAGMSVPENTIVTVLVSTQAVNVDVPNVTSIKTSAAVKALLNAKLNTGIITYEANAQAIGTVLAQNPVSGATVAAGTLVNLVVANGPEMVAVPDLGIGLKTQDEASALLKSIGLVLGSVTQVFDSTYTAGTIIAQSTLPDTSVPAGSSLSVTIVRAAAPNVVGLSKTEAITAITAIAGLSVNPVYRAATAPANQQPLGTVTAQALNAETGVVTLTISSRTVPMWSDHAIGLTLAQLKADLAAAGLTYGGLSTASLPDPIRNLGWIGLYQSSVPAAGSVLFENTPVVVTIYTATVPSLVGTSALSYPNAANFAVTSIGLTLSPDSTTGGLDPAGPADYIPTANAALLGTVAQQDPAANTRLLPDEHGVINTTVSVKIYGTWLPSVIGDNETQAAAILQALQPSNTAFVTKAYVAGVAGTDAEFGTVKTERVKDSGGNYTVDVPVAGLLSTGPVQLGIFGLPIPSTDAAGPLDVSVIGTKTRAQALAAVNAVHTTNGTTTLPYTEKIISVAATPANVGKLVGVSPLSPAGAVYATSVELQIGALAALNVVGKTIGVSGDDVAANTALGILTGASQATANKFPVALISVVEAAPSAADYLGKVVDQIPPVVAPATTVSCYAITLKVGADIPNVAGNWVYNQYNNSTPPVLTDTGAMSELMEFGLVPSVIWLQEPNVALGKVIATLPAAEAIAVQGQAITIYGSGVVVPNFVGMNSAVAANYISDTNNHLSAGDFIGAGTISRQTPAAFSVVEPGTPVSFVAAK